jgi:hypothetical protein
MQPGYLARRETWLYSQTLPEAMKAWMRRKIPQACAPQAGLPELLDGFSG